VNEDDIASVARELAGSRVTDVVRLPGGGNNRVYKVRAENDAYLLKWYGSVDADRRDRLGHEFNALRFLEREGFGEKVPRAIAADPAKKAALYEWIDGAPVGAATRPDVEAALSIVTALYAARNAPDAAGLPEATEATLCIADIIGQIQTRRSGLNAAAAADARLSEFLSEFDLQFTTCVDRLGRRSRDQRRSRTQQTLSPSDFGFHNALRRRNGSLVFVDFEYFGWDDPVKLVADFLWHPGMPLAAAVRLHFLRGATDLYGDDADFPERLAACYPLFGLRWCLIILNEFLESAWARRAFAGKTGDRAASKETQLAKARICLTSVEAYVARGFEALRDS
jgi:hypothetical protein